MNSWVTVLDVKLQSYKFLAHDYCTIANVIVHRSEQ